MKTADRPDVNKRLNERRRTLRRRLLARVVAQAHHPQGLPGRLVGGIMAHRSSNRRRNAWAVEQLDVQPTDRVLEIGFGPGLAIRDLSRRVTAGQVLGIDHSAVMLRQATRRNRSAIGAGRVTLARAAVEDLGTGPPPAGISGPVDKILAVNSFQFWPQPVDRLRELLELLTPGGTLALVLQPRTPGATAQTAQERATEMQALVRQAGFAEPRVAWLDLDPPVACVLAQRPSES
jgi:trans-aconitate methyltransferase